jgi:hypothetical protein
MLFKEQCCSGRGSGGRTICAVTPGTRVEVRTRFDDSWGRGFEIAEVVQDVAPKYRVRRRSDGSVLPALFSNEDVREEKRRSSMWWY